VAGLDDKVSANGFHRVSRVGEVRLIGGLVAPELELPEGLDEGFFEHFQPPAPRKKAAKNYRIVD
jgi:hypothetical protein